MTLRCSASFSSGMNFGRVLVGNPKSTSQKEGLFHTPFLGEEVEEVFRNECAFGVHKLGLQWNQNFLHAGGRRNRGGVALHSGWARSFWNNQPWENCCVSSRLPESAAEMCRYGESCTSGFATVNATEHRLRPNTATNKTIYMSVTEDFFISDCSCGCQQVGVQARYAHVRAIVRILAVSAFLWSDHIEILYSQDVRWGLFLLSHWCLSVVPLTLHDSSGFFRITSCRKWDVCPRSCFFLLQFDLTRRKAACYAFRRRMWHTWWFTSSISAWWSCSFWSSWFLIGRHSGTGTWDPGNRTRRRRLCWNCPMMDLNSCMTRSVVEITWGLGAQPKDLFQNKAKHVNCDFVIHGLLEQLIFDFGSLCITFRFHDQICHRIFGWKGLSSGWPSEGNLKQWSLKIKFVSALFLCFEQIQHAFSVKCVHMRYFQRCHQRLEEDCSFRRSVRPETFR